MAGSNAPFISNRALNRGTLARQGLLARQDCSVEAMLTHLIGLQGQMHNAPYLGLWSRLARFGRADLEVLLQSRRAVRAMLMRCTLHVATAEDFLAIRPLVQPVAEKGYRANHLKGLRGADPEEVRVESRALLGAETLTPSALGSRLQPRWPEVKPVDLSMVARYLEPVVQVPPAGLWGATGPPTITLAERWLGRRADTPIELDALMMRYLAAFGPASGKDFGAWSGLGGGPAALERLRGRLVSFSTEDGRELFDLPEAPRPPEEEPAPVRLLPAYDNVILGYDERQRVLTPEAFRGLWLGNGLSPAFTVGGFVAGSWKLAQGKGRAGIVLSQFEPLTTHEAVALEDEAAALLAAFAPDATPEIVLTDYEPG